jgi:hypothetical protein
MLNASEEKIIQHLIAADQAKIYWDSDQTFLNDLIMMRACL